MATYNNSPVNDPRYIDNSIQATNYPDQNYQAQHDANIGNFNAIKDYQGQVYQGLDNYAKTGIRSTVNGPPAVSIPTVPASTVDQQMKKTGDSNIDDKFNEIQILRSELDGKLRELYYTETSILSDSKMEFDTAIYSGILWTILATCTVYYIFVKL
jgi:hypothetical protein